MALLSWGVAGGGGRVPSSLNLAAVVGDCAVDGSRSCPEVTVESSKAAQYSSALGAASLLQRHGFASLRIEGAGDVTLAVEMPSDSYGRLEATATLIVDVFVDGANALPRSAPAELRRDDFSKWEKLLGLRECFIRRDRRGLRVAGRRERARASSCAVACGSLLRSPSRAAPGTASSLKCAGAVLGRPAALDRHSRAPLRGGAGLRAAARRPGRALSATSSAASSTAAGAAACRGVSASRTAA